MIFNYGSCIVYLCQSGVEFYTLTIEPIPSTATVELIASGYSQIGNTIRVRGNTPVTCIVSEDGYVPQKTTIIVTQTETRTITLEQGVLFTVNATPADSTITFTIDNTDFTGENAIYVPINRAFTYKVEKENYKTYTSPATTVSTATTVSVTLQPLTPVNLDDYNYTINSNQDAVLTEYTGSGTDITVPEV